MCLEYLDCIPALCSVISESQLAGALMTIRWMGNGVQRVEACLLVADQVASLVGSHPEATPLPSPLPSGLVDCARAALGGEPDVSAGAFRSVSDDVSEVALW